jgi:dTDP-glucose 4,6-dehydratase
MTYAGSPENLAEVENCPNYSFIHGDIADEALVDQVFSEEKPFAIVNFAAESHVDRSILSSRPFLQTNVQGVQTLLDAARKFQIERFVQISTDEVYGDIPEGHPPATEEAPLNPSNPYSASKAAADLLCLAYLRTYRLSVLVVRSSNNYGPYQFPEKLIPLIIRNAMEGRIMPIYGDGKQVRDWLYVEDNAEAILRVLETGRVGRIYNIGTGEERENIEVVRRICGVIADETGSDIESLWNQVSFVEDRPGHDRRYAMDTRRIREELGWSPRAAFDEGLRQTVRWYLSHGDWVQRLITDEYYGYHEAVYGRSWGRKSNGN